MTDLQTQMLRSVNFAAIALYFWYLLLLAKRANLNLDYAPPVKAYGFAPALLFVVFLGLAFILPFKTFNTIDWAVFLFLAFPNALWVMWKMRDTIEA